MRITFKKINIKCNLCLLFLLLICFKLNGQKVEWVDFFTKGTAGDHLIKINDSLLVVACNNEFGPSKAYLYNIQGQRLDSIEFDLRNNPWIHKAIHLNDNFLCFFFSEGHTIITSKDLKNSGYISLPLVSIYQILNHNNGIYLYGSNKNKDRNYVNLYLNRNLQIVKKDSTNDFSAFNILYLFENLDYIHFSKIGGSPIIYKKNSLNQEIWKLKLDNDIIIQKVIEAKNGDLIVLGRQLIETMVIKENMVVGRINSTGEIIWLKYFEPDNKRDDLWDFKRGTKITELNDECIQIIGWDGFIVNGPISFLMITKLDKNGQLLWNYYDQFCFEGNMLSDFFTDDENNLYSSGEVCTSDFTGPRMGVLLKFSPPTINNLDIVQNKFYILPNPAKENMVIDIDPSLTIKIMNIYNINGVKMNTLQFTSNYSIDVSNFPTGIYFCELTLEDGSKYRSRFVKQ